MIQYLYNHAVMVGVQHFLTPSCQPPVHASGAYAFDSIYCMHSAPSYMCDKYAETE